MTPCPGIAAGFKLASVATDASSVYLLAFVNEVRAAQSRVPLADIPASGVGALETALSCRIESGGVMRFASQRDATDVASEADLRLGRTAATVELPPAIKRFVRLLALGAEPSSAGYRRAAPGG